MSTTAHRGRMPRRCALVAVTAAGLVLAGCANDTMPTAPAPIPQPVPAPTETAPADEPAVAWTGTICTALVPVVDSLRTPPPVDFTDPAGTRQAYLAYIDGALQRSEQAVHEVNGAGAPPVEGGEELAQNVRDQVSDLRKDLADARARLEAADPGDVAAIGQAVAAAGNVLGSLGNSAQAVGEISADPRLRPAFEQAESCQQLRTIGNSS